MNAARLAFLFLLTAHGVLRACDSSIAEAQDIADVMPPPVADEQLIEDVVRLTAHEAGVDSLGDADGIYAVLITGARERSTTPSSFARAHSPRFFAGATSRRWALELDMGCERPPSFRGRWAEPRAGGARSGTTSRRDACLALVAHVREVVLSIPLCDAQTWGNRRDHERLTRRGIAYRLVVCSALPARNLFSRRIGRRAR